MIAHAPLIVLLLLAATASSSSKDITCKGCVPLDEFNFENVVSKFRATLVKFDVPYPYGEKHEEWRNFAEEVYGNEDLLLAEVAVRFHGAKDNEGLAQKNGAKSKEDLPAVRLFLGNPKEAIGLADGLSVHNLKDLVRNNSDVYVGLSGCVERYDKLAAEFASSEDKRVKLAEIRRMTEDEEDKSSIGVYASIMEKIVENGLGYVANEKRRLSGILKDGKIESKKRLELSRRLNILHSFEVRR